MTWWRQERHGPDYMNRLYATERAFNTDKIKPVIVMGGGAAGTAAAIAAARHGAKVTLLEREKNISYEINKKLALDSAPENGDCDDSLLISEAPPLVNSVLRQFGLKEAADFLKSLGSGLMDELERLQVEVIFGCTVVEIAREKEFYWTVVTAMGDLWIEFKANALVMAVGTGEGYRHNDGAGLFILKKLGVPPPPKLTARMISYKTLGLTEDNANVYLAGELVKPDEWDCVSPLHWALATGHIAGKGAANAAI